MVEETIVLKLTQQEVNVILQMIDKSPVTGTQGMRVVLGLDAKIRQAIKAQVTADLKKDNKVPPRPAETKKDPPVE